MPVCATYPMGARVERTRDPPGTVRDPVSTPALVRLRCVELRYLPSTEPMSTGVAHDTLPSQYCSSLVGVPPLTIRKMRRNGTSSQLTSPPLQGASGSGTLARGVRRLFRSEEHTSELQSLR